MEIRKVNATDDFAAIGNIYAASWKAAYKGIVPQHYLDGLTGEKWAAMLPESALHSFVALDNGVYIGTCAIAPAREEAWPGWGEIVSIYLLPQYYGKGFGRLLLEKAAGALHADGFKQIYLWVLEENARSRRFYERNGFRLSADRLSVSVGGKELMNVRYTFEIE